MVLSCLFHQCLVSGLSLVLDTVSWMVSWMAFVSISIAPVVCSAFWSCSGNRLVLIFSWSLALNIVQSVVLKLYVICLLALFCGILMLVIIGKWSVDGGLVDGLTSQAVMRSIKPLVTKMLSSLEYLFVTLCRRVGIPFGRAMLKS